MSQAYWFIFLSKVHQVINASSNEFKTMVIAKLCMRQRKALQVPMQSFASANAILLREKQHIFLDSTFGRGKLKKLSTSETIIIDI